MTATYVSQTLIRRVVTEPGNASRASWLLQRFTSPRRTSTQPYGVPPTTSLVEARS